MAVGNIAQDKHARLQATREVADLAAGMHRLQAFVYVSTCYVNAHRPKGSHIEEAIYPLTLRSSGQALQHADLAAKLARMTPARAERAVGLSVICWIFLC